MDTPPPATLHDRDLVAALEKGWALRARAIRYQPKGAGSYHWVAEVDGWSTFFLTVDDLDTKPWMGTDRNLTFGKLAAAYDAAWVLRHAGGLDWVVGPIRHRDGSVILRLSDQYTMAVFSFVEGVAGTWGRPMNETHAELIRMLAQLHDATPLVHDRLDRRALDVPKRSLLTAALDALDRPWVGGPFSESARHALAERADDVTRQLARLDTLAAELEAAGGEQVVTHGEPHPGNLIRTASGLRLIDWDTVAVARPERDLWMPADVAPDAVALYEQLSGRRTSPEAIAFYRLAWKLSDIAFLAVMFRSAHPQTRWVEQKWQIFRDLVGGAPSDPYGRR